MAIDSDFYMSTESVTPRRPFYVLVETSWKNEAKISGIIRVDPSVTEHQLAMELAKMLGRTNWAWVTTARPFNLQYFCPLAAKQLMREGITRLEPYDVVNDGEYLFPQAFTLVRQPEEFCRVLE